VVNVSVSDGHAAQSWDTDGEARLWLPQEHTITFSIDGLARTITSVVNGVFASGGSQRAQGWAHLDPTIGAVRNRPLDRNHRTICVVRPGGLLLRSRVRTSSHALRTHFNTHTRTHTHTHARARAHTHTHTHARAPAHTHTHTHTRARAHTHAHTHTHTHTHTQTHTHTHTYICLSRLVVLQVGSASAATCTVHPSVKMLRVYTRYLSTTEAVGNWRHGKLSAAEPVAIDGV
jgi:hypothetical protein